MTAATEVLRVSSASGSRALRVTLAAVAALAALIAAYVVAVALAEPLLTVRSDVMAADTLVVLGGDGPPRAAKAVELWRQGRFADVVVTGRGDCTFIASALVAGGIPGKALDLECSSRSTWENAAFSAPLLVKLRTKSAVIVTSWFHSRRALGRFEAVCPGISWAVDPAEPPGSAIAVAASRYGPWIAAEYLKAIVYAARAAFADPARAPPGRSTCYGTEDSE